jgi:hypothetical protein
LVRAKPLETSSFKAPTVTALVLAVMLELLADFPQLEMAVSSHS